MNVQYFEYLLSGLIISALIFELIWSIVKNESVYILKETLGNLGVFLGNNLIKPLSIGWKYLIFNWVAEFQFFTIPTNAFTVILTFFAAELSYYWYHRTSHETSLLWALHHTHHSGMKMNLTTAIRLNWIGSFISPIFYIPLVLLGFSPQILIYCIAIGLFFQYFLHTEAVKKIGFLEGLFFNTPSAHRVHHGSNKKYIDKNYGGILIIYDRMFGTYQPEEEKVIYGVTTGFYSNNPIKINFLPLLEFFKGKWKREKYLVEEKTAEQLT